MYELIFLELIACFDVIYNEQIVFVLWLSLEPLRLVSPVSLPSIIYDLKEIYLFDHEWHDVILQS